jgi:twitching motility protein PilJ
MSELNLFQNFFSRKAKSSIEEDASLASSESTRTLMEGEPFVDSVTFQEPMPASPAGVEPMQRDALLGPDSAAPTGELLYIPVLGKRTLAAHLQILAALLLLSLVVLALVTFFALSQTKKVSQQLSATGQALMQSQRLAKSVSQAIVGAPQAFPDVKDSSEVLSRSVRALKAGDEQMRIEAVPAEAQVGTALRTISRQSSDLLEIAETVSSLKLQQNAAPTEISAAGQLVMLTQRIGKSANEFLTMEGVNPEAVFILGKDLNSFKEITHDLQSGSAELRLAGTKDVQTLERLDALTKLYEQTRVQAGAILENLQGIVSAREAQVSILSDSEPMRRNLEELQTKLSGDSGLSPASISALVKAIQTDTQDAVAAMERSTQGVVEGAKLSDTAGTALIEIDRVSRRLSELIEQISKATSAEAASANLVADNIQHIFAVTEQTGEGTRATSQQVRELSQRANELRESVSRFKIA